ncbi:hypothetical protein A33M_4152 [Rhodovulum sp. PH10]|nr:hypothetical protein A33M_4152 [Rhodovulum sp. PH10]
MRGMTALLYDLSKPAGGRLPLRSIKGPDPRHPPGATPADASGCCSGSAGLL